MLLRNLGRVALAAAAALFPSILAEDDADNPTGQSTFISPGGQVAFALTVPDHGNTDIYFSLRVPVGVSWGAVGLGSDDMPGALYLMIYMNERGDNVTFSPRLAYGNYEPEYWPDLNFEVLPGTGIFNDYMVFVALCKEHCRSWPSKGTDRGMIDVSSPTQKAIFAYGPNEGFASNSREAPLKYHKGYGTFTIDMKRTQGAADAPVLTLKSKNEGTTFDGEKTGKSDWRTTLHGVMMIICMLGLFPLGVLLLRAGGWVRWHALNQTVAMLIVLGSFALGIVTSFHYQRSRGFKSAHQILGIIVVAFLFGQFALGFLHHKKFKATQAPTKYGKIHLWSGRIIMFLGTLNAFLGFTFALNRRYGMILCGIIILLCFISLALMFGRRAWDRKNRGPQPAPFGAPPYGAPLQGYQPEPWRQQPPPNSMYPSDPPPGYEPPANQNQIGLRPLSPWRPAGRKDDDSDMHLGREQRPREFT